MRRAAQPPIRSRLVQCGFGERTRLLMMDGMDSGEFIGEGSYGEVKAHKDQVTGELCVVKTIPRREKWSRSVLVNEAEVMQGFDHPYILRLLGWYEFDDHVGMLLDYCAGGELMEAVREAKKLHPLSETWAARVTRQLLEALAYCHARDVAHKDIKSQNLLLLTSVPAGQNLFQQRPTAILADWGLAERVTSGGLFASSRGHEVAGTGYTMAPEVWKGLCSTKSDVWSLGCVFFQLLTNRYPFDPPDEHLRGNRESQGRVWLNLQNKGPEWRLCKTSKDSIEVGKQFLTVKERDRPSAARLRSNKWFSKHSKEFDVPRDEAAKACESMRDWHLRHPLQKAMCMTLAVRAQGLTATYASIFTQRDKDRNGVLSKGELSEALQDWGVSPTKAKKVASHLNFNDDGNCSFLEFSAACLPGRPNFPQLLEREFDCLDGSNKGYLVAPQMTKLFDSLMDIVEVEVDPPKLDVKKKGQVTKKEFCAFFGKTPVPYSGPLKKIPRSPGTKLPKRPVKKIMPKPAPKKEKPEPMGVVTNTEANDRRIIESKEESDDDWSNYSWSSWGSWEGSDHEQEAEISGEFGRSVGSSVSTLQGRPGSISLDDFRDKLCSPQQTLPIAKDVADIAKEVADAVAKSSSSRAVAPVPNSPREPRTTGCDELSAVEEACTEGASEAQDALLDEASVDDWLCPAAVAKRLWESDRGPAGRGVSRIVPLGEPLDDFAPPRKQPVIISL